MAFSYSDKNFTVIGNLCFVHIDVKSEVPYYEIPSAISDRMLLDDFRCIFLGTGGGTAPMMNFAYFKSGKIICNGSGYLNCFFPIDSNK